MNGLTIKHKLGSGHAFNTAESILANLEEDVAVRIPENAVHSIAGHVAHMAWWQRQVLLDIQLGKRQRQSTDEFPSTVPQEEWQAVKQDFLSGLEELKQHCENQNLIQQTYIHTNETIAEALLDFAIHNAYHLGQIVLLRRLQGVWNK
ncbi:MAG: hypothetical protein RLZZ156_1261 [Deinococcota bacterium]|jgi:uncharacterized damage-inducible protein DinB